MVEQSAASKLSQALPDTPAPIYQRVKQAIIAQISAGHWQENDRVPSESELVKALGASRMTINRALRELTTEGYLFRMQGVGTFVAKQKGATPMLEVHNIADEITQRGHSHTCKIINLSSIKADPEQAAIFNLKTGHELYYSHIIHYENDTPVQLEERWVNPSMAPDYLHQDYQHQTPYTYLMNIAPLTSGEHIVEAVMADPRQRNYLDIDDYEPCLLIRRQTWSDKQVVTYAKLLYPGSRYKLLGNF
ncbi:HTH-type transcriptional repressor YvoA [Vibrio aerogenes CECT 7868]|uniref:Histidine utilization repressor n=1 Tax=Vibrio aerogenes CECT 7868 TaxID=1216006 RepID=A0A1M5YF25_9VIBR|nr:histidine utilization repressor [Vibrio aerogenes]SHI10661.1 HTH-type transcriptional repressor YvoA [Vibrio aerogenes CECT 7868]